MNVLLAVILRELLLAEDMRGHTPFDYARKEHWDAWVNFLKVNEDFICNHMNICDCIQVIA